MTDDPICSEQEITELVQRFYARVRQDAQLGPIFEAHIDDWDEHLAKLMDFWSSILLRSGRFSGAPMPKHAALPGLTQALFRHWLELFAQTLAEQPNERLAEQAMAAARRIAQSLWMGYQSQGPARPLVVPLAAGPAGRREAQQR
ncbi:preprotein translocase subunit TatC [Vandammella animalimorsus]|uniref:Preprotein translocase subunit TatC n=1 Tax=Vandammella animalimorsus TaxID=2029117 RepID=A0A2A2AQZ3_9BURK|nr:group III truncated hemoglobin [Vandammella animalimorsus]PAT40177.1 preprotein translocase subunit TatC [Vandammella animalimorsus]